MAPPRHEFAIKADSSPLAEPLKLEFSGRVAPNRLMKSAMGETLASWDPVNREKSGVPRKELAELFRRWGQGGWGIINTGNVQISLEHMSQCGDCVIPYGAPFEGERFENFKAVATAAKAHGSLVVLQALHPGRQTKSSFTKESISASAVPFPPSPYGSFAPPREATQADIDGVIAAFAYAARYSEAAGFDGFVLHAAHGYLLSQFLSPTTNKRTDRYGSGSITNRIRIITEIAAAIRKCTKPGFILAAKLNIIEFQPEGLTPDDAAEMARAWPAATFDWVELSGGNLEDPAMVHKSDSTRKRGAFFLDAAETVIPALGPPGQRKTKAFVVGGLRSVGAMVGALEAGLDGVCIGRPATFEPELPRRIFEDKVSGAFKVLPPLEDFYLGLSAAGSQMWAMAKGFEPFDLTDEKVVQHFLKDHEARMALVAADGDRMTLFGYTEYTGELKKHVPHLRAAL